jgi:uncharacterized protein (TIGR02996 family)
MAKVRGLLNSSRLPLRFHSSVREFIGSIRENPFDQARWLVFADWLAENGYEFYERRVRLRVASGKAYDQFARRLSEAIDKQEYLKYRFRQMAEKSWPAYHWAATQALHGLGLKDWSLYQFAYLAGVQSLGFSDPMLIIPAPIWGSGRELEAKATFVLAAMGLDLCPEFLRLSVFCVYPWEWPRHPWGWPRLPATEGGRPA